jgi:hypothetical protein
MSTFSRPIAKRGQRMKVGIMVTIVPCHDTSMATEPQDNSFRQLGVNPGTTPLDPAVISKYENKNIPIPKFVD